MTHWRARLAGWGLLLSLGLPAQVLADDALGRLLVFTSPICYYCTTFMKEAGSIYPKTAVGRKLPMTEVDLTDPGPYRELAKSVCFTPTFIVLDSAGREQARFRGYRSEEAFWSDLEGAVTNLEKIAAIAP